jgi:prevent-host-death family protein
VLTTVTAYEAKTHLPRLLRAAERGETVIITRHGKPVAQLGPVQQAHGFDMAEANDEPRSPAPPAIQDSARGASFGAPRQSQVLRHPSKSSACNS